MSAKLRHDLDKAARDIAALRKVMHKCPDLDVSATAIMVQACQSEEARLSRAMLDHALLWSIYRRSQAGSYR